MKNVILIPHIQHLFHTTVMHFLTRKNTFELTIFSPFGFEICYGVFRYEVLVPMLTFIMSKSIIL